MIYSKKTITYPLLGLLSLIIGLLIMNANLNVHSGEIFLWLIGIFGFFLLFPILLFAKSVRLLVVELKHEQSTARTYGVVLTTVLGLGWVAIMAVGILKEL